MVSRIEVEGSILGSSCGANKMGGGYLVSSTKNPGETDPVFQKNDGCKEWTRNQPPEKRDGGCSQRTLSSRFLCKPTPPSAKHGGTRPEPRCLNFEVGHAALQRQRTSARFEDGAAQWRNHAQNIYYTYTWTFLHAQHFRLYDKKGIFSRQQPKTRISWPTPT